MTNAASPFSVSVTSDALIVELSSAVRVSMPSTSDAP